MPKRLPPEQRRSNNLYLKLDQRERAALDRQADRFEVEFQTYLRTLILAADAGELNVTSRLFDR